MTTEAQNAARVRLTQSDFDLFRLLVIRHRWDWPAVFSVNSKGQIWPWVRNGLTPLEERHLIGGLSPIVDAIADILLFERSLGGRFFINERGAWMKPEGQFAAFEFTT